VLALEKRGTNPFSQPQFSNIFAVCCSDATSALEMLLLDQSMSTTVPKLVSDKAYK
jgi:hypothetical protein